MRASKSPHFLYFLKSQEAEPLALLFDAHRRFPSVPGGLKLQQRTLRLCQSTEREDAGARRRILQSREDRKHIMHKFGMLDSAGNDMPYRYPNLWSREQTTGPERIVAAPATSHIDLMIALSRVLPEPFGILYVLLVSRSDQEPGRYQSPVPVSRAEMEAFVQEFKAFLEGDGRHHVWVASLPDHATLVYDQHNVLYAYGPLSEYESVLRQRGLQEGEVRFPLPHTHHYDTPFDGEAARLLAYWEWQRFPLIEGEDTR